MSTLSLSKRSLLELAFLLVVSLIIYFVSGSLDVSIFFMMGFIWNWTASQDLSAIFQNKRYRFSMLKLVTNIQALMLKPFKKAPEFVRFLIRILPAGIFWYAVIYYNESVMPWWAVFLGSLTLEAIQLNPSFLKINKENPL